MLKQDRVLFYFFPVLIMGFIVTGLVYSGTSAITGFIAIQLQPARLISDFIMTEGIGAALVNSAAVGLVGYIFILAAGTRLSGPTFAAVFTMMGFGLFGKTPVNIIPVLAGVILSAKFVYKGLKDYIIIALFGTALGPLVSTAAVEIGLTGAAAVLGGAFGGVVTGFLLPALAVSMLHLHQGYNLYNMGLTCGFLSLFLASLIKAGGVPLEGIMSWHAENPPLLILLVPVLSLFLILLALIGGGKSSLSSFVKILKKPGRLPSDFIDMTSVWGAFINSGLIGLIGSAYVYFIGADFNGPVIGGLLTVMGFAAFGTHLKNAWPVVAGVIIAALLFGKPLTAPGVILAAIFCTTLAPIAGQFGIIPGVIAGFLHLVMVSQTGSWQGGMNLYNNGFAGGMTAALIVAVAQWYKTNRQKDE